MGGRLQVQLHAQSLQLGLVLHQLLFCLLGLVLGLTQLVAVLGGQAVNILVILGVFLFNLFLQPVQSIKAVTVDSTEAVTLSIYFLSHMQLNLTDCMM